MKGGMDTTGDTVHERVITMTTRGLDENHIAFEGRLHEKRMKDYYLFSGEKRPAGDLHDMSIRLLLKIPELLIEDVEVEMTTVPRDECNDIAQSMLAVKGMRIKPGFTMEVRAMLAGVKGCTHLSHLLQTMAPAAMQGMWAYTAHMPPHERDDMVQTGQMQAVVERLKNSCYAWREDGRAYRRMSEFIKKMNGS